MNALLRGFYVFLLWTTSFELAIAKNAPERNPVLIANLQADESEYEGKLARLELGI